MQTGPMAAACAHEKHMEHTLQDSKAPHSCAVRRPVQMQHSLTPEAAR